MIETLKRYITKKQKIKIYIKPKGKVRFTGKISSLSNGTITIIDKYNQEVIISISSILNIFPVNESESYDIKN